MLQTIITRCACRTYSMTRARIKLEIKKKKNEAAMTAVSDKWVSEFLMRVKCFIYAAVIATSFFRISSCASESIEPVFFIELRSINLSWCQLLQWIWCRKKQMELRIHSMVRYGACMFRIFESIEIIKPSRNMQIRFNWTCKFISSLPAHCIVYTTQAERK